MEATNLEVKLLALRLSDQEDLDGRLRTYRDGLIKSDALFDEVAEWLAPLIEKNLVRVSRERMFQDVLVRATPVVRLRIDVRDLSIDLAPPSLMAFGLTSNPRDSRVTAMQGFWSLTLSVTHQSTIGSYRLIHARTGDWEVTPNTFEGKPALFDFPWLQDLIGQTLDRRQSHRDTF
jgi:hypothetical protein